jgi:hypothetical protein
MNIYSKLALTTAQGCAWLATLGILGTTTPSVASSLTFEVSGILVDRVFDSNSPLSGTFTGTFSYDPEAADLEPENPNVGKYPISEFSLIFRNLSGNPIAFADSENEVCNCTIYSPDTGFESLYDNDFANLIINPSGSIKLNFFDNFGGGFRQVSVFENKTVLLEFGYRSATDTLPSTTEEFLANVGDFVSFSPEFGRIQPIYTRSSKSPGGFGGGPELYSTSATITAASQSVPEPSGVGALSLLSLGFFLKKKGTSSRKAKATAKV